MKNRARLELAVVIPVYKDLKGATSSLQSLRVAIWPKPGIVILVDDGSDPPLCIVPEQWSPLNVRVERLRANAGIEAALNAGLRVARQLSVSYIARLDAGDTIDKERLSKQLAFMADHPDVGIVGSDVEFVGETGELLFRFAAPPTDEGIRRRMHVNACLIHPAVMMRSTVLDSAGMYSTEFPTAEDYELFFRILAISKAASIPEVLTRTVVTAGGISLRRRRRQLISRLRIQAKYFDPKRLTSFWGIAVTMLLFVIPTGFVRALKRQLGVSRY